MDEGDALHVGVLAYPGCFATEVFGLADLFVMANLLDARTGGSGRLFTTTVLGRSPEVVAAGGHGLRTAPGHTPVDVLVVPGFEVAGARHVEPVIDQLGAEVAHVRAAGEAGLPVASVCVGAFVLGAAGVLDGRRATTSWLFAGELQRRHPTCTVEDESMIVTDGAVTTTAAFSAVHDLALRFVRGVGGDTLARRLARMTLVADNRSSQLPYIDESLLDAPGAGMVRDAKRWLIERIDRPYDLAELASAFHVSPRTMLRRFAAEASCTPLDHLQTARIRAAKRRLEDPDHTVASAMRAVGYSDLTSFRRLFHRHVGMSPGAYRSSFGASDGGGR